MSKFEEQFNEVNHFSDNCLVISGYIPLSDAVEAFSEYIDDYVDEASVELKLVRYGFAPENVVDAEDLGACWYTGAKSGKGSKKVWCLG